MTFQFDSVTVSVEEKEDAPIFTVYDSSQEILYQGESIYEAWYVLMKTLNNYRIFIPKALEKYLG